MCVCDGVDLLLYIIFVSRSFSRSSRRRRVERFVVMCCI